LSPQDYQRFVLPSVKNVIAQVKQNHPATPVIYFGTETCGFIRHVSAFNADVIGVDWRVDLLDAWSVIGHKMAIQGNLDPMVLRAPIPEITRQAGYILDRVNKRPGHIFNLGHGVHKETPPDHVAALIDFVHTHGKR
jgi:uroporphyrinogen decarboxylase